MFADLTYQLTRRWLQEQAALQVVERTSGPSLSDDPVLQEILDFREQQLRQAAPHLQSPLQRSLEERLQLDKRSLHYALYTAHRGKRLAAYVRLTPAPFEFAALHPELRNQEERYRGYFEFSRLTTATDLERKGYHAGVLVVAAALAALSQRGARGMIGICRLDKTHYMKKLGLRTVSAPFRLTERGADYQLIAASRWRLLQHYFLRGVFYFLSEKINHVYRIAQKSS